MYILSIVYVSEIRIGQYQVVLLLQFSSSVCLSGKLGDKKFVFLLSLNISWSASRPVSAIRPEENDPIYGFNPEVLNLDIIQHMIYDPMSGFNLVLPGPGPRPGTIARLWPGPGSRSGAGPSERREFGLNSSVFLSNLDLESLRLLGLRDLDLDRDRDRPPPLPSSNSLILSTFSWFDCFMKTNPPSSSQLRPVKLVKGVLHVAPARELRDSFTAPVCRGGVSDFYPGRCRWSSLTSTWCRGSWCRSPLLPASCSPSGPGNQDVIDSPWGPEDNKV